MNTEWMDRAACRDKRYDPDWWMEKPDTLDAGFAAGVCRTCPAAAECFAHAIARPRDSVYTTRGGKYLVPNKHRSGVVPARYQAIPRNPAELVPAPVGGLTVAQAAQRLGMSTNGVLLAIRSGRIPATKDQRGWHRIPESVVAGYKPWSNPRRAAA